MRIGHLPILALSVVAVLIAGSGRAEPAGPDPEAMALDLSRIAVAEAGFDVRANEVGAFHAVLQDRARRMGVGYRTAARWYASRHFDRGRGDRRRWIPFLNRRAVRPEGWPRGASWSARRGRWRDLLILSEEYVRGESAPPCRPSHWGNREDVVRFLRHYPDAEVVDCGDGVRNVFLRVTSQAEVGGQPS